MQREQGPVPYKKLIRISGRGWHRQWSPCKLLVRLQALPLQACAPVTEKTPGTALALIAPKRAEGSLEQVSRIQPGWLLSGVFGTFLPAMVTDAKAASLNATMPIIITVGHGVAWYRRFSGAVKYQGRVDFFSKGATLARHLILMSDWCVSV